MAATSETMSVENGLEQPAVAWFDHKGRLSAHSDSWLAGLSPLVAERVRAGMSFQELVNVELTVAPLARLGDRERKAWQRARLKRFQSGDGRAIEIRMANAKKRRIHCFRLQTSETLVWHRDSVGDEPSDLGEESLPHLATHDELTGLHNRLGLQHALQRMLHAARHDNGGCGLVFLDIDKIQVINDSGGYVAGDALLCEIAKLVQGMAGDNGVAARLGGDEFAIAIADINREDLLQLARNACKAVRNQSFHWQQQPFRITASVGAAHATGATNCATDFLRAADSACYAAKDAGGDRIKLFSHDDSTLNLRHSRLHWVARINSALSEDRFTLYVQPIVHTSGLPDSYLHFEVLVRMRLRDGQIGNPGEFLPAAEQYNLITEVDRWIVNRAIALVNEHVLFQDHLDTLSVNLSGRSIGDASFREHVYKLLAGHAQLAPKICFEVTETAVINKLKEGQRFIHQMRELGCRFALDDFGAGLSSFAYLKELDVDYLKIDGAFVRDIDKNPVHKAMVRSINEVGHVMNKKTIAEFVESEQIRQELLEIGVDYIQGFAVAKPTPFEDVL